MEYRAVLTRKIIGIDYVIMSAMTYVRIEVHFRHIAKENRTVSDVC